MMARGETGPVAELAPWLFVFANVAIVLSSVGTSSLLLRGRLLPAVAATAPPAATVSQGAY